MNAWNSIQKTLNWIEENVSEEMDIAGLAEKAHLSQFYYQRLFTKLVGKPVMEYIKLRRLASAADYLAANRGKILDVAFKFGFENHETFTRSFRDAYGMTPEEYRKAPRPLSHFLKPQLALRYELIDEDVPLVADGIVLEIRNTSLKQPRFFSGLSVQSPMGNVPGVDILAELWAAFHEQKGDIADVISDGDEIGVSLQGAAEGYFTYFVGAETHVNSEQPGYINWTVSEGEYAVCSFDAENFYLLTTDALMKASAYMFETWLPHHKLKTDDFMAELYSDTSPSATNMELWIPLRP